MDERVSRELNQSIVVGIVTQYGDEYLVAGSLSADDSRAPDKNTLFEIGDLTKLFTAAATSDLVQRRQLTWRTPAGALLPLEGRPPAYDGEAVNLHHLASHSSGLPRIPPNMGEVDPRNPWADYSEEQLYEATSQTYPAFPPGSHYLYSSLGYGLLGHILTLRTGKSYEEVIAESITTPLAMKDTVVVPTEHQSKRLAPGHEGLTEVPGWDMSTLPGAGALKSTAGDLAIFLKAQMGMVRTPKAQIFGVMHAPIISSGSRDTLSGYAWQVTTKEGSTVLWHTGHTGGYQAFVGFNPARRVGVVVLTNTNQKIDELGFYALAPDVFPLGQFPPLPRINEAALERCVGVYEVTPEVRITITRRADNLYARFSDGPLYRLYPITATRFGLAKGDYIFDFQGRNTQAPAPALKVEEKLQSYIARRKEP